MSLIIVKIILNKYLDLKVLSIKNKIKIKILLVKIIFDKKFYKLTYIDETKK